MTYPPSGPYRPPVPGQAHPGTPTQAMPLALALALPPVWGRRVAAG